MSLKRLLEIKRRKAELEAGIDKMDDKQVDEAMREAEKLEEEENEVKKRMLESDTEIEKRGKQIGFIGADKQQKIELGVDSAEYRSAFFKRFAGVPLTEIEQRAMNTNSNSAGAAVPTTTLNKILEKVENNAVVYGLVTVSHLKGNVTIPLERTTNDVQRKTEGAEATIADDTLGKIQLGAKKYIKLVQLTCELEATAIDALEDYIVSKLAKKFAQAFDYDILNGEGTLGAKGILKILTPIETQSVNTLTYDDICTLFGKLSAAAKKGATLMMSTETLYTKVATIKDDVKRPIFNVETNKVLGREVVECDDVPNGTIIFGDFSQYMFNWNKELEITKSGEAAFKSGDTVFRGLALVDGDLADLGAMKVLKIKESQTQEG